MIQTVAATLGQRPDAEECLVGRYKYSLPSQPGLRSSVTFLSSHWGAEDAFPSPVCLLFTRPSFPSTRTHSADHQEPRQGCNCGGQKLGGGRSPSHTCRALERQVQDQRAPALLPTTTILASSCGHSDRPPPIVPKAGLALGCTYPHPALP